MKKLFYPESIVIFGISSKPNNIPRLILENLIRWRYPGRIFGVNPVSTDDQVDGIKMYRSIEELPIVPDLAAALIPARYVPQTIEACGRFGVKFMAIPSGGFNELGEEGKRLAEQTIATAQEYGVRFVGPNGLSVANTDIGLCLPFVPTYMPPKGGLSIITQSGGLGIMLWNLLAEEDVGMAKFASIGNKLDLDEVDILKYYGEDPQTKVICIYLESITRGRELCDAAAAIDKPVIILKANTTTSGQKTAVSHTAAVSNNDEIVDAAFERAGIIRIDRFSEFISVAKTFQLPPMRGNRIMLMSPAGGFGVIAADLSEKLEFDLADPGREFYETLEKSSNAGIIGFSNPLDMGDIYDPKMYANTFYSVLHNDNVDGALFVSQYPEMPRGNDPFHSMFRTDISKEAIGAVLSSNKPFGVCLFGQSESIHKIKKNLSIPIFNTLEEMIKGFRRQSNFYAKKAAGTPKPELPKNIDLEKIANWLRLKNGTVGEESLDILTPLGLQASQSKVMVSAKDAIAFTRKAGYPVVMKVVSPDAVHKSDAGGVLLDINDESKVASGFDTIHKNLMNYKADAIFDGVRVAKQAVEGHDMFVGTVFDPTFGPVVFFGFGGIYIEVFKDVQCLLCPATRDEISEKVNRLKSYKILAGTRGKPAADIEGFIDVIERISHLVARFPEIKELDLNPVRLPAKGSSAIVLDARLVVERELCKIPPIPK
jgi:acetate---CoA ligase (ADP-forming)